MAPSARLAREVEGIIKLKVKVVPGSSRNCIAGWLGDTLKVRVTAAAERGKANAAVEETLAKALGVARGSVRIVRGAGSPRKIVEIAGLPEAEVHRRLEKDVEPPPGWATRRMNHTREVARLPTFTDVTHR